MKPLYERIDTDSSTWRGIKEWAESRLQTLRASLEAPGLGPMETEFARGGVSELKQLLKQAEPKINPTLSAEDVD